MLKLVPIKQEKLKNRLNNLILNISISVFSLTLCLLVCEIGIRFTNLVNINKRALMYSSETFYLDQSGAVRYHPNKKIRTVTVYNGKIEYDVYFNTNNLGFVDEVDYKYENDPNKKYYALVGDSFTAGYHGGEPWIPKLRSNIDEKKIEIYNLGVDGTGIEHFYRLLKSSREQFYVTHIIILAISKDFQRSLWYPHTSSSEIRFCKENEIVSECNKRPYIAKIIDSKASNDEILMIADKIHKEKKKYSSSSGIRGLLKRSELITFFYRSYNEKLNIKKRNIRNSFSVDILRKIKNEFKSAEICLIHLPNKSEVIDGKYILNNIGKEIEDIGIIYYPILQQTHWKEDMFHVNDGHPNSLGYDNIKKFVLNNIISKE